MSSSTIKAGILGASGYTGVTLIQLLDRHPHVNLTSLGAERHAGQAADVVFPHLPADIPPMVTLEDMPLDRLDVLFLGLPHTKSAEIIADLFTRYPHLKLIDLSADFRLNSAVLYKESYGVEHPAPHLLHEGVYGFSEIYAAQIRQARLVACTGCYCICAETPLVPLLRAGMIKHENIVIDAKSGVSGAGRSAKPDLIFSEVHQGLHAYAVGTHRHGWEIEQELSLAAGKAVQTTFTPHLIPINRGILATCHVQVNKAIHSQDIIACWQDFYADQPFVRVFDKGILPKVQYVVGSNMVMLGAADDRVPGRVVLISVLDNLLKGASGQAVQNMNLMFGWPQEVGLDRIALYP